jgi:hypothetical protein
MRPAWSGSDVAALTEQITREVTRALEGTGRPPRKRSSTRDIPSDPHRAGVIAPDETGTRAGSVEFESHSHAEPRTAPQYEEPGPYPGLDAPSRTLGQPAPRPARWTPGGVREESGPKPGPTWSPPLAAPEPEPRDSDPVWQPPEWLTPPKRTAVQPEAELPSWSPPPVGPASPAPKSSWAPPAVPAAPVVPAPAWTPPQAAAAAAAPAAALAHAIRPSAVAPAEDEYVDGGFASEFDDDEFDDGPTSEDEFPTIELAAQSGRHRKRRRLDQPVIEIPQQPARPSVGAPPARPDPALEHDDDFADEPAPAAAKGKPAPAAKSERATSERPRAKQPRDDDDDDDFDDDDDDDDDFGDDDDDEESPAANSSSQLGASVTAPKDKAGGRKLPWLPIGAVASGLVLVLAFAFRDTLFGASDDSDPADSAGDTGTDGAEPASEPEPEPEPKPEPKPEPEPAPPAIPAEELEAKIAEATSLVNRQKFDDARVILDEVLGKIPNEGRALALVAQTHLEKNKLEDALATANDCVAADAKQAFCWIIIATVEQGNDNLPRALEAYRKYLEVEPDGQHAKSAKKQITRLEGKVG